MPTARQHWTYLDFSDVSRGTLTHHPARPGWAASQLRCVICADRLPTYEAVPILDDVWQRALVRFFFSRLVTPMKTAPAWNLSLFHFELGWEWSLQWATCLSPGWLWRCSSSSSALVTVRLWLHPGRAPLANGFTVAIVVPDCPPVAVQPGRRDDARQSRLLWTSFTLTLDLNWEYE